MKDNLDIIVSRLCFNQGSKCVFLRSSHHIFCPRYRGHECLVSSAMTVVLVGGAVTNVTERCSYAKGKRSPSAL